MSDSQELSNCHKAPVTIGGTGDFNDADRAVTQYYVCTECRQPCDLWRPDSQAELDTILDQASKPKLKRDVLNLLEDADMNGYKRGFKEAEAYAERLAARRAVADTMSYPPHSRRPN